MTWLMGVLIFGGVHVASSGLLAGRLSNRFVFNIVRVSSCAFTWWLPEWLTLGVVCLALGQAVLVSSVYSDPNSKPDPGPFT